MTDIQIIIGVSVALLIFIVAPLIFLYYKGPWRFRTTIPNLVILIILFCLLYTPVHELSHIAGAYLSGVQVMDIQLFPKILAGHIVTARYHPLNVRSVWQFVIMTGFPYILNVIGSALGIFFLRRNFSKNSFVVGFLFMLLCFRPAFDFTGETLGFLSRNGGDIHQISRCIGVSTTWWILSFSIGLTLLSIFIVMNRFTGSPRLKKGGIFLLFFIVESLVFAIITLSPYLPQTALLGFHAGLTVTILIIALFLRRSEKGKQYWPVFYAFFVAGAAVLTSGLFSNNLLGLFGQTVTTPQGIAVAKFSEGVLRVIPILILMPAGGLDWRSMYLKVGKVRFWLPIAIAALVVFPAFAYFSLSSNQTGVLDKLLPLWPWILLFVLSNGFMEELLYRGVFLKQYEPFLGKGLSIILTAIVFAIMHTQVTYAAQMIQFLVIVLVLSLIWGVLIQKTDSLWGAVLFHAAGDCLIVFAAFASM